MPMSTPALSGAIAAGAVAAVAVASQRIGLGLALAVLLVITAGALDAQPRPCRLSLLLAVALAIQPLILDAGWVVAIDVIAALIGAAFAVRHPESWSGVVRSLLVPWRLLGGAALVARATSARRPETESAHVWSVVRGLALAAVLTATFGVLFAAADSAFADLLEGAVSFELEAGDLFWRLTVAIAFTAAGGALARPAARGPDGGATGPRWVVGGIELRIALGALALSFATFVAMQLRVLFGGAEYVRSVTGLGYGDYARQGFVQLLLVAGLTLAVIAFSARQQDRVVRGLLGLLCLFTLVVLVSAHHRLGLVEDAYGYTRVRYGGHAIIIWLALSFGIVLAAGCSPLVGRALPRIAMPTTLTLVLLFSITNPDARIASRAVDRALDGGTLDGPYLGGLSADALPAAERLPPRLRTPVVAELRRRLNRPDGLAGLNLSRARAR